MHRCSLHYRAGQQDVSAQLQLHLYRTADDPNTITSVSNQLLGVSQGVDRPAASLALLRGWADDTAETDAAHGTLSVQEQGVAGETAGVCWLLVLVAAAHKAAVVAGA